MVIRSILFDLDGTVINSLPGIFESFRYILEKYFPDRPIDRNAILKHVGRPLEELMLEISGDEQQANVLIDDYRRHNRTLIPSMDFFSMMSTTLDQLKDQGFKLAIVTSKNQASTALSVETLDLTKWFEVIIARDETKVHKPDPTPLFLGIERLGSKVEESVYVGDSIFDIQCANNAQCRSIAALWGSIDKDAVLKENPTWNFDCPSKILEITP